MQKKAELFLEQKLKDKGWSSLDSFTDSRNLNRFELISWLVDFSESISKNTMKTNFIISKGWHILHTYDFLVPATIGSVFIKSGIEYRVEDVLIDDEDNSLTYLVKQ